MTSKSERRMLAEVIRADETGTLQKQLATLIEDRLARQKRQYVDQVRHLQDELQREHVASLTNTVAKLRVEIIVLQTQQQRAGFLDRLFGRDGRDRADPQADDTQSKGSADATTDESRNRNDATS